MNLEENRRAFPIPHQLADELAGGLQNLIVCTGTKDFGPIYPGNEDLGGFYFSYPRRFAKNRSNLARILALKNGKRRIEWYNYRKGYGMRLTTTELLETADNIEPADLESVWWEHTACAVRPPWIIDAFKSRVKLGKVFTTRGVDENFSRDEIRACIKRHAAGDWGDICEEDRKTNEESLDERNPRRVMSAYKLSGERVLWVITEWNWEATTVLMPDEY